MTSYKSELCSHYKTYFKSLMFVRFGQCMDMSRIRTAAIFTTRTLCTVKLSSQLLHLRASFSLSGRTFFLSGRKVCHSFGLEGVQPEKGPPPSGVSGEKDTRNCHPGLHRAVVQAVVNPCGFSHCELPNHAVIWKTSHIGHT